MRIGLNAQKLFLSRDYRNAGISRYIRGIAEHLPQEGPEHQYVLFTNPQVRQWDGPNDGAIELHPARLPTTHPLVRILWEQAVQPRLARRCRLDVLHCPLNVAPLLEVCPVVVTVHDLTFVHFPERFPLAKRLYLTAATRRSVRAAAHVLADSASTRADLLRHFGAAPEQVSIAYPGVDPRFRACREPDQLAAFRRRHGLPERYILYLGTLEPRKNADLLVRAFALLAREPETPQALVLAGGKGWGYQRVFQAIEETGLGDRVLVPGYVEPEEQPLWYNAAQLFIYPSQYEGFGLPLLEAMACGTPVIASNTSSLPEVVGEAGLLVDPADVEQLAGAMRRVLTSPSLASELGARGMRQAARFSWAEAARGCLAAYSAAARYGSCRVPERRPSAVAPRQHHGAGPPNGDASSIDSGY